MSFRRLQDEFRTTIGDRIFFAAASHDIGARARAVLTAQAEWLSRRPEIEITIEGHADDAMAGADNDQISARRVEMVRQRLVAEGVAPERISLSPKGATDPVAVCQDSECAAQNRRVVLVVGLRRIETGLGPDPFVAGRSPPAPDKR